MHVDVIFLEIFKMENFVTKMFEIRARILIFIILSMYFRFSNFDVGKQRFVYLSYLCVRDMFYPLVFVLRSGTRPVAKGSTRGHCPPAKSWRRPCAEAPVPPCRTPVPPCRNKLAGQARKKRSTDLDSAYPKTYRNNKYLREIVLNCDFIEKKSNSQIRLPPPLLKRGVKLEKNGLRIWIQRTRKPI